LASAVSASCALPGVMKPAKLKTKNSLGEIEDFEVDGVEWIDGSVQADLPFQRISTLFNVSNFVVCQTNFHVVPFLNKERISKSSYRKLFQTIEWDIRSRALKLSGLGLFPKFFGQDISTLSFVLSMSDSSIIGNECNKQKIIKTDPSLFLSTVSFSFKTHTRQAKYSSKSTMVI
jgi:predicted acylesterase/phospholipase RssA